jgi:hypothetical protein
LKVTSATAGRKRGQPESAHQQRRVPRRSVHRARGFRSDAANRKRIYSQINDYILDQSFGLPVAASTSRVITKSNVQGLEFRYNDVMYLGNTWMS